jgi:hypothetical protein
MARLAALAVLAVFTLVACGGSDESADTAALAAQPCGVEVCGAPGTEMTVQLAGFDHGTDLLVVVIGESPATLVVSATTQPLLAEPCAAGGLIAALIEQWNATAPMNPLGHFDVMGDEEPGGPGSGAYHRVLEKLARAGASATLTIAADATTVAMFRPICPATN